MPRRSAAGHVEFGLNCVVLPLVLLVLVILLLLRSTAHFSHPAKRRSDRPLCHGLLSLSGQTAIRQWETTIAHPKRQSAATRRHIASRKTLAITPSLPAVRFCRRGSCRDIHADSMSTDLHERVSGFIPQ